MVFCDICERNVGSVHCIPKKYPRRYIRYCKDCDGVKRLDDYLS